MADITVMIIAKETVTEMVIFVGYPESMQLMFLDAALWTSSGLGMLLLFSMLARKPLFLLTTSQYEGVEAKPPQSWGSSFVYSHMMK